MPFAPSKPPRANRAVLTARKHFHAMGWSYRSAAAVLGVSYQHLSEVLNGRRPSRRLLAAVHNLPARTR